MKWQVGDEFYSEDCATAQTIDNVGKTGIWTRDNHFYTFAQIKPVNTINTQLKLQSMVDKFNEDNKFEDTVTISAGTKPSDVSLLEGKSLRSSNEESLRHNSGKIQTREIDPAFILGMAEVLTKSRAKYPHFNWCKPTKFSTPMESLERHLLAWKSGEDIDPDDGLHHILKVAVNAMFIYYHDRTNKEESDDRFFKGKKND